MTLPRHLQGHCTLRGDIDGFTPELEFWVDWAVEDDAINGMLRVEGGMESADRGMVYHLF